MSDSINNKDLFTLLNLPEDDSIIVSDISISNGIKYIHVSRKSSFHHCPFDGHKMQSKGIYKREIIHPGIYTSSFIRVNENALIVRDVSMNPILS